MLDNSPKNDADTGDHWLSVSDLMSGLMIVFLFIAITYMLQVQAENQKMKDVAITYQETQVAIYEALNKEFDSDLGRWKARIDEDSLAFEFEAPEVLFDSGAIDLKPQFRMILDDFFPRYLAVLEPFRNTIDEIRIEGHTSSLWRGERSPDRAYFKNMKLSQGRTRAVLEHVYSLDRLDDEREWVKANVAAVGFSSARPMLYEDGAEDVDASRRVSFRVRTNADIQIKKILETVE